LLTRTEDKKTYFLGRTDAGQTGREDTKQSPHPTLLPELNGVPVSQLCSGWGHTLAISSGTVFSWGSNMHSQCGHNIKSRISPVKQIPLKSTIEKLSCGGCHSMLLDSNKGVFIFGSGGDGKMMSPTNCKTNIFTQQFIADLLEPTLIKWFVENNIQVEDIASGIDHLCILDSKL
jgi:alpha-tubulin suppressor-like RCC1 family protein